MTDQTDLPDLADDGEGEPFAIVPTAKWGMGIERRLNDLETRPQPAAAVLQPAGLTPDQEQRLFEALQALDGRLTRHRREIDDLKTNQNQLGEYVERNVPAAPAGGSVL